MIKNNTTQKIRAASQLFINKLGTAANETLKMAQVSGARKSSAARYIKAPKR